MVQGVPLRNAVIGLTRGSTDQAGAITGMPRREAHHHAHPDHSGAVGRAHGGFGGAHPRRRPRRTALTGTGRSGDERDAEPHTIVWCRDKKASARYLTGILGLGNGVSSNPSPVTTCGNGQLAGISRLCGPFFLYLVVCHLVTLWGAVSRCPRTYSGRRPRPRTVGAHRRLSTDGHGRAALASCSGLTCAVESGVHPRVSTRRPGGSPRAGRAGKGGCADDWGGGSGERDACRVSRAGAGRPFVRRRGARPGAPVRGCRGPAGKRAFRQQRAAQRLGFSRGDGHGCGGGRGWHSPGRGHRPRRAGGAPAALGWRGRGGRAGAGTGGDPGRRVGLAAARRADRDLVLRHG
jgi:hypothetical protein